MLKKIQPKQDVVVRGTVGVRHAQPLAIGIKRIRHVCAVTHARAVDTRSPPDGRTSDPGCVKYDHRGRAYEYQNIAPGRRVKDFARHFPRATSWSNGDFTRQGSERIR